MCKHLLISEQFRVDIRWSLLAVETVQSPEGLFLFVHLYLSNFGQKILFL